MKFKTQVDDEWRVCAICKIYKLRSEFERARFQKWTRRSYRCKECKKDYIEEYKKKWGNKKLIEYRKKKRKLDIGEFIIFPWDVEKDLSIYWTIQKYKVIDYIFGIGYKVQNLASNKISKFITGEVKSPNCKKFWKN